MKTTRTITNSRNGLAGLATVLLLFASIGLGWTQTTNVWTDNFESPTVWDNWSVDNGVWEIGSPLTGPATNSVGYRTHEGTNCAATVLNGNYPASTSSRLIRTLPFVVPSASQNPRLQFWHWYQFSGNSYGVVQIKYGTNPWTDLSPRYYATGSGVWTRPVVDLSAYAGKAVQIAFQIAADGNVEDGWDVDQVSVIKGPYTVGFTNGATESFESGLGDWYAETGTWEVGVPTYGPPTNAAGSMTHSGTNCLATVLDGNYEADRSSRFISPAFVVPSADQLPRLRFWEWFSIGGYDFVQVQIKVGTNAWQGLSDQITADSFSRWTRAFLDLTPYAGQTVQLGFYFQSGDSGYWHYYTSPSPGWYVDEVRIETGPSPAFALPSQPEDFENGWGGWQVDYIGGRVTDFGIWEIGQPTYGPPTNAFGLRAHSGTNCAATVLNEDYPADRTARLVSPPFVVPSADQLPRLRFWEWFSIGGYDFVQVQIKVGTNAWQGLSDQITADSFSRWTRAFLDLTPYAGQTVQLGFYFQSGDSGYWHYYTSPSPGWYVDEVRIETGPSPAFALPSQPEDFENGWGGWQVDYIGGRVTDFGIWEIGQPTYGPPTNAFGLRAHSGTNCAATVLNEDYPADRTARLVSPPFVVPSADQLPRLRFWEWFSIGGYDFVQVQIKVGTNAWQGLSDQITADSFSRWTRAFLDLTPYAGQTVQLGFYFQSGDSGYWHYYTSPSPGWYVDEVRIETGPSPAFALPSQPEDFENGWGGWQVDYIGGRVTDFGIWEIGQPTYGPPTNAFGLRAHSGTNCAATVLNEDYPADRTARLVSPPFVVPPVGTHPTLRFWHWFSIGTYDFCQLQIKPAGGTWQTLAQYNPGDSVVWSRPSFDLSQYAGQTVELGFYFQSGDSGYWHYYTSPSPGWYVDEVMITDVTPPTGIVQFTDVRYFANEGETTATITMERKYGSSGAVDVTFVATDDTAVGGVDFDSVVDTISWADGEQGVKTDIVPIHQNCSVRGNKIVTLQLLVPGSVVSLVAREEAELIIVDTCAPPLSITTNIAYLRSLVGTTDWVPTNTTMMFTVDGTVTTYTNLSQTASDEMFLMQDGTNGIAVLFLGGTNQFMPQSGDRLRVTATLTNINGLLALAPDYANITNTVWRLSTSNALPTPALLDFASRTSVPVMEAMEARYVIATNVWVSQSDGAYFPTVMANVAVTNQAGTTFDLTIHPNLTNAGQLKPTGPVNILGVLIQDDPTAPYTTNYSLLPTEIQGGNGVIQFVATSYAVSESAPTVTLSVSRTGANNGPVSVTFATVNGTALAGADYVATNGVLSWADGEGGIKTITVQILNDAVEELDEVFTVGLSGVALGANATAQVTIVNDDFVVRPAYVALPAGSNTVFSVTPTAGTVGYQWWKDGAMKVNATNATLTVANVQTNDSGNYWVAVTTTLGTVTSSTGQLVVAIPVTITNQPQSQTVTAGSYVSLCVGGSGTQPFTYQWLRNGAVLSNATNACLVLLSAQTTDTANYSVVVNNPANLPVVSENAALTVFGGVFVPDKGGLGSYVISNGCYIVSGGGEDIEGTEDRFFFVSTTLAGDGQIIAHLGGMVPDNPLSEAGVMLRDGFVGGDRHAFLALNANNLTVFRRRQDANYPSVQNWYHGTNSAWLRLARMGDTFVGHYSTNGVNWELVWWTTMPTMPANLQAGLAVTAHRNDGTNTATFCSVSVGGLTPLSGPWTEPGPRIYIGGESGGMAEFQRVGGFKFLVGGVLGDQFIIKWSASAAAPLASWAALGTVTNQYGVVPFLDSQALTNAKRFYRAQRIGP